MILENMLKFQVNCALSKTLHCRVFCLFLFFFTNKVPENDYYVSDILQAISDYLLGTNGIFCFIAILTLWSSLIICVITYAIHVSHDRLETLGGQSL